MKYIHQILSALLLAGLISCDPNRIIEENREIENASWSVQDTKSFSFNISDTNLHYNVFLNVRNNNEYTYRNLYLFVEMTSPSNKYFVDTVEIFLADNKGKWLGSGIGNVWLNQVALLEKVKLKEIGAYSVKINHGMRHEMLKAINDIGIRVERAND